MAMVKLRAKLPGRFRVFPSGELGEEKKREHGVAGFGVGIFGELSAECFGL